MESSLALHVKLKPQNLLLLSKIFTEITISGRAKQGPEWLSFKVTLH